MTELTLNRRAIKSEFKSQQKLNDVIDHLFENEIEKENILVHLNIDGEQIPFEEGLEVSQKSLENFNSIDFETQTSLELAFEAVDSCNEYIDILTEKIQSLSQLYQKGSIDEANTAFVEVIDILDLYIQLFSRIHTTLKRNFEEGLAISENIQKLDIHLLSVLKALIPAKEKGDIIMLCDLLEYELIDNLTKWKIQIIPSLKKLKKIENV